MRLAYRQLLKLAAISVALMGAEGAAAYTAASKEALRQKTQQDVFQSVQSQLTKHCGESCELIRVDVEVNEVVDEHTELGFEAVSSPGGRPNWVVAKVVASVQIDDSINQQNRQRLQALINNNLRTYTNNPLVELRPVQLPSIGGNSSSLSPNVYQSQLEGQIEQALNKVIKTYCPEHCLLSYVGVNGTLISTSEADSLPRTQVYRDPAGRVLMRIDRVSIEVSIDESVDSATRASIESMFAASTKFVSPVTMNVSMVKFPETYLSRQQRENANDPYGLEKLRQMLIMFRDLAGTKEIITNSTATNTNREASVTSTNSTLENNSVEKSMNKLATLDQKQSTNQLISEEWMWAGLAVLIGIIAIVAAVRVMGAQRDAKLMIETAESVSPDNSRRSGARYESGRDRDQAGSGVRAGSEVDYVKLLSDRLKVELAQQFTLNGKVARLTFSRMLREDGIELTAKYLQIFGQLIVLELIDDANLGRDLLALAEFYHKSNIQLSEDEELTLLQNLKTRMTANEIKVLTAKGAERFEFLEKMDDQRIYALIRKERPQIQGVVLLQLDKKRRMAIFDMFEGQSKVDLMNELCRTENVSSEYATAVAGALQKKAATSPEFNVEPVRGSDVMVDLLERSTLGEQKQIIQHLQQNYPDTAKSVLSNLVTIHFLDYLRDGHVLDIFMSLERADVLTFLAGSNNHYRNLVMSKSPPELVESWLEELQMMTVVDEVRLRDVTAVICNKIRNMANLGVINIAEVNESIYAGSADVAGIGNGGAHSPKHSVA